MTSTGALKQWRVWLLLGGRGSGKTRAGAEWIRSIARGDDTEPRLAAGSPQGSRRAPPRIALVGKTLADVRNVMIEGQSGLLAIHPAYERPDFEPSKRRLTWPNGAVAELFSADEAEALRGPQFTAAWCDELAKWRGAERAWDMLQFALRLGDAPRVCVTTTPRATKLLKQIIADEATVTVNLATADNATNLAPSFLAEMTRRYAGSAIGRQELLGEIVEDASDGLWRRHWIEEARIANAPEMQRVVVALDPPVTATASSDACGIVVAGRPKARRYRNSTAAHASVARSSGRPISRKTSSRRRKPSAAGRERRAATRPASRNTTIMQTSPWPWPRESSRASAAFGPTSKNSTSHAPRFAFIPAPKPKPSTV
ncbi:MAG: terminase family protein [Hyphomicrobium sp.]